MSRMGNYVLEMQEAAQYMTRYAFERAYGKTNVHVWDEQNLHFEDMEPDIIDEEFAYDGC